MKRNHPVQNQKKTWENTITKRKNDLNCFAYVTAFRFKYEGALKKNYSVKITVIPFKGGAIIENRIVNKDEAQTIKFEKIYPLEEALKMVNLEFWEKPGSEKEQIKGTSIIINRDVCYLIKENSLKEWKPEKAREDIRLITEDLLPSAKTRH